MMRTDVESAIASETDPMLTTTSSDAVHLPRQKPLWTLCVFVLSLIVLVGTKLSPPEYRKTPANGGTIREQPGLHTAHTGDAYAIEVAVAHPESNTETVAELLSRATNGDAKAQEILGVVYTEGNFGVVPKASTALYWFQQAVATGGQDNASAAAVSAATGAEYSIGLMYLQGTSATPQNLKVAAGYVNQSATDGNCLAQHSLGAMYFSGEGMEQNYTAAVKWYKAAAGQNVTESEDSLGFMYMNGIGVKQNYRTALEWYQKAADKGNEEAQGYLGYMYANGVGVSQNDELAVHWLQLSAAQGYPASQKLLAQMYIEGRGGLNKDPQMAAKWITEAQTSAAP